MTVRDRDSMTQERVPIGRLARLDAPVQGDHEERELERGDGYLSHSKPSTVIPAKAGIQTMPTAAKPLPDILWIPAFAGMTVIATAPAG